MKHTLTMLLHGESGVGKSTTADTVPSPRLILDAEGRAKYTPSGPKIMWDPRVSGPPAANGWRTCIVPVVDFETVGLVYAWLASGQHPFRSVVVDSLMEMQKRAIDNIAGVEQMKTQDWGEVLRKLETQVRSMRDLTIVEANPVEVVVFIVGSTIDDTGKTRPLLQGQLKNTVPYYLDVVGYQYTEVDVVSGALSRKLLTQPTPGFVAKDGTGVLPAIMDIPDSRQVDPTTGGHRLFVSEMQQMMIDRGKVETVPAFTPETTNGGATA